MKKEEIARYIDHTLLKADAKSSDIEILCKEALEYKFASVCINPVHVKLASSILYGTEVKVCTVIGFPLGANCTSTKVAEAVQAIADGALEIDMVINIGRLKEGDFDFVKQDIKSLVEIAKGKAITKVIIETCLLNEEEKNTACKIAMEAGADYVKTSTGFSVSGAKVEDIRLMRAAVGDKLGVKASGGVRSYKEAINMIEAGATRIGASASIEIYNNAE